MLTNAEPRAISLDRFRERVREQRPLRSFRSDGGIHRRARPVIRAGVLGLGLVGWASGVVLFGASWLSASASFVDPIQLWIARFLAPFLASIGLWYCYLPFRAAPPAKVLPFRAT